MRVWVVNPFDPIPGESVRPGRYAFICDQLARAGHQVTWWSSNFFHTLKKERSEGRGERQLHENLRIALLPTPPYRKNVSLRRLYNHYIFARQFAKASVQEPVPDLLLASFPPIGSSREVSQYGRRTGARVILDVQDLWPEAFELAAPRSLLRPLHHCFWPFRRAARDALSWADGIMGVSQTYVDYGLRHAGRPIPSLILPLGVDLEAFDGRVDESAPKSIHRERSAIYIGTIGTSYDLRTVLEAASMSSSAGDQIIFRIVGDGPHLPSLRQAAERMRLPNVIFHGLMPFGELTFLLRRSMVGLHAIANGSPQTLTNKLFDYLAAGLPVLNSSPGETADLLAKEKIGISYLAGDPEALCRSLGVLLGDKARWEEMSARARRLAVERYDRRMIYKQLIPFLEQICVD
jgi:glycosyltransferase involved in cell wall biosynthesis